VVILARLQGAADDHIAEKRRLPLFQSGAGEIASNAEFYFVVAGPEGAGIQQRRIRSAVGIGYGSRDQVAAALERKQLDLDSGARPAAGRIEYVCCQSTHKAPEIQPASAAAIVGDLHPALHPFAPGMHPVINDLRKSRQAVDTAKLYSKEWVAGV
jgi:hypothetical protein